MDNPVGIAFLPNGERFFTTTFLQHPAAGKRDGIIHAVYGGIWGKDHDVISRLRPHVDRIPGARDCRDDDHRIRMRTRGLDQTSGPVRR